MFRYRCLGYCYTVLIKLFIPLSYRMRLHTEIRTRKNYYEQPQLNADDCHQITVMRYAALPDAFCVCGITTIDLFSQGTNYIFGEALIAQRVGMFSFARYLPSWKPLYPPKGAPPEHDALALMHYRCISVLTHEIGHLYGFAHCIWFQCLMNGSNYLEEADASPAHLCPIDLRKLSMALEHTCDSKDKEGLDFIARYRALLSSFKALGIKSEVQWVQKRLESLQRKELSSGKTTKIDKKVTQVPKQ